MRDLIERLEAASEGNIALDRAVLDALGYDCIPDRGSHYWVGSDGVVEDERVTTSVDAALALVEKKLPGVWFVLGRGKMRDTEPLHGARLLFGADEIISEAEHDQLPMALCIALLRALSQGDGHG